MGGVPVLLLFAAIGVTYGWQPDGGGGVEYIIQVPAEQVDRLQETGEISSVIDPQVQGHVSRVVIRVGNQPLPRETPPHVAQLRHEVPVAPGAAGRGSRMAANDGSRSGIVETQSREPTAFDANDQNPIPIPQMTERSPAQPIPGLSAPSTKLAGSPTGIGAQAESMMKPDASNSAAGPGFNFPNSALPQSLQPQSLQEAAENAAASARDGLTTAVQALGNQTRNEIDTAINRAGQGVQESASGLADRANDALRNGFNVGGASAAAAGNGQPNAAATTANPRSGNFDVPSFTGSSAAGTTNRNVAAAPSTDPMAGGRDKDWRDLNDPNLRPQGISSPMPTTDPISSSAANSRSAVDPRSPAAQATQPRMVTNPATGTSSNMGLGTSSTFGRPPEALNPSRPNSNDTASNDLQAYQQRQQYEKEQFERAQYQRDQAARAQSNLPPSAPASSPFAQGTASPYNAAEQNNRPLDRNPNDRNLTQASNFDAAATSAIANGDPRVSPNDAGMPPGAWSVDAYGRYIDREGRLLDRFGRLLPNQNAPVAPNPRLAEQTPATATPSPREPMNYGTNPNGSNGSQGNPGNFAGMPNAPVLASQNGMNPDNTRSPSDQDRRYDARDAALAAEREAYLKSQSTPKSFAAQSLFNMLFLISMAGNLYLVVWLKNLRHQFHELVAAKRMSQNTGAPVV
ncbi:hypothetical protein Pla52o_46600 [Novipirellula galeiformis]|uniref:Uncharacterized protein n=1 Tax=Novipirellula galeiformis TaxID=2528004 RepID=A0A5C6C9U6_9BACT|nr:hypothetical protein [Novipirellula galeiformis]TWU20146.1 hypothetical protein Pla52o_46600 [Novipirellula galeiformis]